MVPVCHNAEKPISGSQNETETLPKIPNLLFEQVATLVPAGNQFVPGNRWLGPFLFGLPTRERIAVGGGSNPFIPKE